MQTTNKIISKYSKFIFDLDGTIYRGENIIPGATETINYLKSIEKSILFISNKTTGTVKEYYNFLISFGLNISESELINSTLTTKSYLKQNHKTEPFFAVGEKTFLDELISEGLVFSNDPDKIKILIVTLDRTLNYEKLEIAAKALENGAHFYAANIDDTCPVDGGEVMDAGSTISALEKRTHKKLEKHFGKPSDFMIEEIKRYFKDDLSDAIIIGDRLETDILMGNKMQIDSVLVASGVKFFSNGNTDIKPTYHLNSVLDLIED